MGLMGPMSHMGPNPYNSYIGDPFLRNSMRGSQGIHSLLPRTNDIDTNLDKSIAKEIGYIQPRHAVLRTF